MQTWVITLTVPDGVTREQLTEELRQVCEAGFDLTTEQYTVRVEPQAIAA